MSITIIKTLNWTESFFINIIYNIFKNTEQIRGENHFNGNVLQLLV